MRPAPDEPVPAAPRRVVELIYMEVGSVGTQTRRPRFRRAAEPPPFRLTSDDGSADWRRAKIGDHRVIFCGYGQSAQVL